MEIWKEQIHRSRYLKDYYKGREGSHPIFGKRKDRPAEKQCWKCGAKAELLRLTNKIGNLEIEYYLCQECNARRTNQKMAGNR